MTTTREERAFKPNQTIQGHQKVLEDMLKYAKDKGLTSHQGELELTGQYDDKTKSAIKEVQRLLGYKETGRLTGEQIRTLYGRSYMAEGALVEPKSPPSTSPHFGHRELVANQQRLLNKFLAEEQKAGRLKDIKPLADDGVFGEKTRQLTQAFRKANGFNPELMRGGFSEFHDPSLDLLKKKYGSVVSVQAAQPVMPAAAPVAVPPAAPAGKVEAKPEVPRNPNGDAKRMMVTFATAFQGQGGNAPEAKADAKPAEAAPALKQIAKREDPKANPDGSGRDVPPEPKAPAAKDIGTSQPLPSSDVAAAVKGIRDAVKGQTFGEDRLKIVSYLSDAERNKQIDAQMRAESKKGEGLADYITGFGAITGNSGKLAREIAETGYNPERFSDILLDRDKKFKQHATAKAFVIAATPKDKIDELAALVESSRKEGEPTFRKALNEAMRAVDYKGGRDAVKAGWNYLHIETKDVAGKIEIVKYPGPEEAVAAAAPAEKQAEIQTEKKSAEAQEAPKEAAAAEKDKRPGFVRRVVNGAGNGIGHAFQETKEFVVDDVPGFVGDRGRDLKKLAMPVIEPVQDVVEASGLTPMKLVGAGLDFVPGGEAVEVGVAALGGVAQHFGLFGGPKADQPRETIVLNDYRAVVRESLGGLPGVENYAETYGKETAVKELFSPTAVSYLEAIASNKQQGNAVPNAVEYANQLKTQNPDFYRELEDYSQFQYGKSFEEFLVS